MQRINSEPVVFQIGFNRCGTKFLSSLFEKNNYNARHWCNGALAEDILYSKLTGNQPLQKWEKAHFFLDMECVHETHKPMMEGFKEYRYLAEIFPDAIFLLNERNVEEWIASRFSHHGGDYRRFHAYHLGVKEIDLPEIWFKDWETHLDQCTSFFENNERFIRYNIDEDEPEKLVEHFSSWYDLKNIPSHPLRKRIKVQQLNAVVNILTDVEPRDSSNNSKYIDTGFSLDVAQHCIGKCIQADDSFQKEPMSNLFSVWDGLDVISKKSGGALSLVRRDTDNRLFVANRDEPKVGRAQGVVNDFIRLGVSKPVRMDMQDARLFGSGEYASPTHQLITYCRRKGAQNMVLWPLGGYHSSYGKHFIREEVMDPIPFENKKDVCVWRGNLAGRSFTQGGAKTRPSHLILQDIINGPQDETTQETLYTELLTLPRYNVIHRLMGHPDFDLGITLSGKNKRAASTDLLHLYCKPNEPTEWFYGFKYRLSLSGYDTGSNFLSAACSNSVVLKEEDGWELFYTSMFRPWEHYIPLLPNAVDLEDRLAWARKNQSQCIEMSKAAQNVCAKLANLTNRHSYLSMIAEAYQY